MYIWKYLQGFSRNLYSTEL